MDGKLNVTDIGFLEKLLNVAPFLVLAIAAMVVIICMIALIDWLLLRKQRIPDQLLKGNIAWAIVLGAFIFSMFYLAGQAIGAPTDRFDRHFRQANKAYFSTALPWRWAKAQGMQESGLMQYVCSPVGACGLMQFMPATARQFRIDPFNPRASIYAAAKYMKWLHRNWSAPRPRLDRHYLALASYNWGLGNVLRIQRLIKKRGGIGKLWVEFVRFVPRETAEYPFRIRRWCERFKGGRACTIFQ